MPTNIQTCVISSRSHDHVRAVQARLQALGIVAHESFCQSAVDFLKNSWGLTVKGDPFTVERVKQVVTEMKYTDLKCQVYGVSIKADGAPEDWYMKVPDKPAGTDVKVTIAMKVDIGAKWIFLAELVELVEALGAVIGDYESAERWPIDRARQFWAIVTVPVEGKDEAVRLVEERLLGFAGASRSSVEPVLAD